jgi:hypothetical protein
MAGAAWAARRGGSGVAVEAGIPVAWMMRRRVRVSVAATLIFDQ